MKTGTPLLALWLVSLAGCGAGPGTSCNLTTVLVVEPTPATANSSAKPPGNQVQLNSSFAFNTSNRNCPVPAIGQLAYPIWTNPDTIHISISSAGDATNGTAICKGPTPGPVALTATAASPSTSTEQLTATAQLTCN